MNDSTLKSIQADSLETMYLTVTKAALYIAAGGFLDQANQLLTGLWQHHLPHPMELWAEDQALTMLWHTAGSHPDFIPFVPKDIQEIEKAHRTYLTSNRMDCIEALSCDWQTLSGLDLLRLANFMAACGKGNAAYRPQALEKIMKMQANTDNNGTPCKESIKTILAKMGDYLAGIKAQQEEEQFPPELKELLSLEMLQKLIHEEDAPIEAIALAAELAAKNGKMEIAGKLLQSWANNPGQEKENETPLFLSSRHVTPLLLDKIITNQLELSQTRSQTFVEKALSNMQKNIAASIPLHI